MAKKIFFFLTGAFAVIGLCGFLIVSASPVPAKKAAGYAFPEHVQLEEWTGEVSGPIELTWKMLSDVQFKDVYVEELDSYYWKPTFGAAVKALEGKEVFITGYMIPVDYEDNFYVISRYPYANCFFCGGGGPESVVDLRFSGKHRVYKTDERLTFKGKLKLNADNIYEMNYIMLNAVEYTP